MDIIIISTLISINSRVGNHTDYYPDAHFVSPLSI